MLTYRHQIDSVAEEVERQKSSNDMVDINIGMHGISLCRLINRIEVHYLIHCLIKLSAVGIFVRRDWASAFRRNTSRCR